MNERHRNKRLAAFRYLLALPRSLWYNFRLLPMRQAIHLPILISHRTRLENLSGRIDLQADSLRIGLVKIGFNTYQHTYFRHDRTQVNLRGLWVLKGECAIGAGSCIHVGEQGVLIFGEKTNIGPKTLIICHRSIELGRQTQTSWSCTLMDTDQHRLVDEHGTLCNEDRPIHLGEGVWLGCHVIVAKGTNLAPYTTVGAGSVVHGKHDEPRTVLAGNPAQVVKRGVAREDFLV